MEFINSLLLTLLFLPFILYETGGRSLRIRRQVPQIPGVLRSDDPKYTKPNVPIDIFMSMWEAQGGLKGSSYDPCTIVIPADSSFEIFVEPLRKADAITELKKISYNSYFPFASSKEPLLRYTKKKIFEGASSLSNATFMNPAIAKIHNIQDGKLMAWKSLKTGQLVINGARVLFELGFNNDKCVVFVAESFPFSRSNNVYQTFLQRLIAGQDMQNRFT